jgi:S1-C subfamily serine protease
MKILLSAFICCLSINLFGQCLDNETEFKKYFTENSASLDPIEGIWSTDFSVRVYDIYGNLLRKDKNELPGTSVIIRRNGNEFVSCPIKALSGSSGKEATFLKTAANGIYVHNIPFDITSENVQCNATLNNGILDYSYELPEQIADEISKIRSRKKMKFAYDVQMIKLFPTEADLKSNRKLTGSGFAISSNGIIATNYHVVENAKSIKIKGGNLDFNKAYSAKILISDRHNDLALIQINDPAFNSLKAIPYTIKTTLAGIGENVFVLGYPLTATMGDEIKLTNGIINSKTGFQGDITSYQVSAPVQPGNSGGPLFDSQGNLIGIINSKHLGAENVSYAVKSNYLMSLIDLLPVTPKLQVLNSLAGKSLTDQVELVKNFVYIIEVN